MPNDDAPVSGASENDAVSNCVEHLDKLLDAVTPVLHEDLQDNLR